MATETRLLTADEFFRMPGSDKWTELVRGEVRRMTPPGGTHGILQGNAYLPVAEYAREHGGAALVETGFVLRTKPDTVRGPDVSYVHPERVPLEHAEGFWPGAPDLALEVVSPGDTAQEVDEKVQEYLAAGSRLVLVVHPRTETITAYRPDGSAAVLRAGDVLDGGDAMPGFRLPVEQVFRRPGPRRSAAP